MTNIKRGHVLQEINQLLANNGFETSHIYERSCFDMVARRKLLLLLLKVLVNIDGINGVQAQEIRKISRSFMASPLIVGLKSKNEHLEEDVVYERHGIPVIGLETLKNMIIEGEYPEILADRGGYYVQINGEVLKEVREDYNLSLKDLADLAHVSRETIYKYEHGIVRACPETAMMLEDILNLKITLSIDLFKVPDSLKELNIGKSNESPLNDNKINMNEFQPQKLVELGFGIIPTQKTPFDALAKLESNNPISKNVETPLITNLEKNRKQRTLKKMAITLKDLSLITGSSSVFILDNEKIKESLDGIPVVHGWEMGEIETPAEFLKMIKERKECN
ncbi:MAG: transcriptional regulator [Methanobacteriaceae archaeon]|nr:transcriptional regulator [Methanobacteriaceae archaeon]MDP2837123.1 transcriptional regulator [Methanobacteriaceae archaeon]MDP3035648.1 transcriptional regulator [Methanobacteriaceae archaeon]MDP3485652.1 transcriptional regulator [Methanobacteriaceae archaeon]MDP3624080.1 transcriptional regulator [Methanobacteriaceae archaeon]